MKENSTEVQEPIQSDSHEGIKQMCGIIMPISLIDGCSETHWKDVMSIIKQCIVKAGFDSNLVSDADDTGIIQKRIIQNLYENPIVVCDVSAKNPNVMFELGIRLAFDKPTIIIKDDKTSYSFDTSSIEHLDYPRDLRYNKIEEFKVKLVDKIKKTYDKSISDSDYSTFLKHFGEFKTTKLETKEVSKEDFIIDQIESIQKIVSKLVRKSPIRNSDEKLTRKLIICVRPLDGCHFGKSAYAEIEGIVNEMGFDSTLIDKTHSGHIHISLESPDATDDLFESLKSVNDGSWIVRKLRKGTV